ncbi:MAG: MBL fold metallo-hydrolase [Acidobacteriota bacterium]|nr:MBL fold metallo-hydrolase [Acidobacteriota bacterium]
MGMRILGSLAVGWVLCGPATWTLAEEGIQAPRDFDMEIEAALREAKAAAGFEFLGTLSRNCLLPASGGVNTSDDVPRYIRDPSSEQPRETWYANSAQVFDNLFFVGGKVHTAWALATSEGIIIIDTVYPYNSEELIIGGLERLGLDPQEIRYVIISHAHGDHSGGAQMLQERYGAEVVMGGGATGTSSKPIRTGTRRWHRDAISSRLMVCS